MKQLNGVQILVCKKNSIEELPMKKCCLLHTEQGPQTLLMMLSDWREHGARAAAWACVRVSVCVRLHYVH